MDSNNGTKNKTTVVNLGKFELVRIRFFGALRTTTE